VTSGIYIDCLIERALACNRSEVSAAIVYSRQHWPRNTRVGLTRDAKLLEIKFKVVV
jgi:hypothetical protein